MNNQTNNTMKLTLVRSRSGRKQKHIAILDCLKLKKIRDSVVVGCTDSTEGMVKIVSYLLNVERI